jgi:phage baseplate assembly protein W
MKHKKYSDLDPLFAIHPVTSDLIIKRDERAIKFALKSLVMTSIFERPFHSELSSPVRAMLFDNFGDNFEIIMREAIAQLVTTYEPRVELLNVDVKPSHDNNSVYIKIYFRIKNTLQELDVGFMLERTR